MELCEAGITYRPSSTLHMVWLIQVWLVQIWLVQIWLIQVWLVQVWLIKVWLVQAGITSTYRHSSTLHMVWLLSAVITLLVLTLRILARQTCYVCMWYVSCQSPHVRMFWDLIRWEMGIAALDTNWTSWRHGGYMWMCCVGRLQTHDWPIEVKNMTSITF